MDDFDSLVADHKRLRILELLAEQPLTDKQLRRKAGYSCMTSMLYQAGLLETARYISRDKQLLGDEVTNTYSVTLLGLDAVAGLADRAARIVQKAKSTNCCGDCGPAVQRT